MNGDGRRELVVTPYNAFVELLYASSPSEDSDVKTKIEYNFKKTKIDI